MKGQITIPIVLTMGGMLAAAIAGIYGFRFEAQQDIAGLSERIARLETSVPQMQGDIKDIKTSSANIEKALRIKP